MGVILETEAGPFQCGTLVCSPKFGPGTITAVSGEGQGLFYTIEFQVGGTKRIVAAYGRLTPYPHGQTANSQVMRALPIDGSITNREEVQSQKSQPMEAPPNQGGSNVFQMYMANGWKAGFWVRRTNWVNTLAIIKSVGGLESGELSGQPPYFNQSGKGSPKVICDVFDATTGVARDKSSLLSCPGTYTYRKVPTPGWAETFMASSQS